jgi:hypothetical protein
MFFLSRVGLKELTRGSVKKQLLLIEVHRCPWRVSFLFHKLRDKSSLYRDLRCQFTEDYNTSNFLQGATAGGVMENACIDRRA